MRKYPILFILLWSIHVLTNGQSEKPFLKGNFLIGGSLSCGYNKDNAFTPGSNPTPDQSATTQTFTFGTDINTAYFFVKNFAAGLKFENQLSKYKTVFEFNGTYASTVKGSDNVFSIGPVIRYYSNFGLFLELYYGLCKSKNNWADYTNIEKQSLWSTSIGYSYFLLNKVALEPQIKYSSLNSKWSEIPDKETLHKIEFLVGIQIYL